MKPSKKMFFVLNIIFLLTVNLFSQTEGEKIFIQTCRACHTIGEGKLVGPDLYNVSQKRNENWLLSFIKSSQTMIKSNDPEAVAIFNEYNKVVMPDQNLTDQQIRMILSYISTVSSTVDTTKVFSAANQFTLQSSGGFTIPTLYRAGFVDARNLFDGNIRLQNGGPACISCHNIVDNNMIGGGLLALDLTTAFSRLGGEAAINSIISNPPFPAMAAAYANNPVTPDEAFLLTAYLYKTDKDSVYQTPVNYQSRFLQSGIIGTALLFGLYGALWWNRKKKSVNHDIYKRQIQTK